MIYMNKDIKFPLLSGDIAIDLVNTEVISHGQRHDLLAERKHLIAWMNILAEADIIYHEQLQAPIEQWAAEALPSLRSLRSYLRQQFERMADGLQAAPNWITQLEAIIKHAPIAYQWRNERLLPIPVGNPQDALLSLVALNTLQLLANSQLQYLHRCGNPECVLLFIDSNRRRKWCSMKICGNRIKVTRHNQLKKQEQANNRQTKSFDTI